MSSAGVLRALFVPEGIFYLKSLEVSLLGRNLSRFVSSKTIRDVAGELLKLFCVLKLFARLHGNSSVCVCSAVLNVLDFP